MDSELCNMSYKYILTYIVNYVILQHEWQTNHE
jgi:hypothetical protein